MCRAADQGGRRCPAHQDPQSRHGTVVRQRISRYARAADTAQDAGDVTAVARFDRLFEKALAEAQPSPTPVPKVPTTRAAEFTLDRTVDMSDEDLGTAWSACAADPAAQAAIEDVLDWRDRVAGERDAEIAALRAQQEARADAAWATGGTLLDNPSLRPARMLTVDEQVREQYECYVETAYLTAENDCQGVLINARGRAAGISARSLFLGSSTVARAYASEELKGWWLKNGRMSLGKFRYHALHRRSDRDAATSGEDWTDAVAV